MSEQEQKAVQEAPTNNESGSEDQSVDRSQVLLSPERSLKKEDDDITPWYVRGYN